MPDMIPVATQIQPPDPSKGLSTLSSIIGIRQQQQALQTGKYLQQTAQAGAIEAQQGAKELQAGAKLLSDPIGNGLIDEEGNPTKNAYSIIKSVMPTTGDDRYTSLLKTAQGHVEFRNSVQNLSQNEQGYISSRLAGIAADPNAHISDVVNGFDDLKNQFKGTAEEASVNRLVKVMKDAVDDAGDKHGMDGVRQVVNGFSRGAVGNQGLTGPGGVVTPSVGTYQAPGGLQPYQTNPMAPGGIRPVGQAMPNVAPPAIVTPPGGIPTVTGPGGRNPTQITGSAPGPAPTTQDWENFGHYQSNLNNRVAVATDSIPRIQEAEKALDQIRGGHGAQGYAKLGQILQAVGAPQSLIDSVSNGNLAASQEAEKYLFQTTFSGLRQAMQGDPARVAEFQSAEQVFPSIGTDPRASRAVLNFMVDQGKRDYAEQQALTNARRGGTFNPATWQADYQQQLRAGKVPGVPQSQVPGGGEQKGKSKSGKPIVFRNGRWEYE